jgi:hypothetical protein
MKPARSAPDLHWISERREKIGEREDRLAVGRFAGPQHEFGQYQAIGFAGLSFERPGTIFASAAQIDDGLDAVFGCLGDLAGGRLRRAPEPRRDLVTVQIDDPENAMVGEDHIHPRVEPIPARHDRAIPTGNARHAAGVSLIV